MSQVSDNRRKLLGRLNRLIGQMNALRREIENAEGDEPCRSIMQQIASVRGAVNGLMMLFLEEHVRKHVARAPSVRERDRATDDLLSALRSFGG